MNEAIKLAIEKGGYEHHMQKLGLEVSTWIPMYPAIAQDHLFWQALGKALGWENKQHPHARFNLAKEYDEPPLYVEERVHCHVYHALHYHYLVLTGGDTEKFWKELIKTNAITPNENRAS